MMKLLLLLLCLLPSSLYAAVPVTTLKVINPPSHFWLERVEADIKRNNQFLCRAFTQLPEQVRLVAIDGPPQYDLESGSIYLSENYLPIHLHHEYGHKILDDYLTEHSAVLTYYQLRQRLGGNPLATAIRKLHSNVEEERFFVRQLQERKLPGLAHNLELWIEEQESILFHASSVQHLDGKLSQPYQSLKQQNDLPLAELQAPYHELFADTLAVLVSGSWDSVIMTRDQNTQSQSKRCSFPFNLQSMAAISGHNRRQLRAFQPSASTNMLYLNLGQPTDHYSQFASARAYIRFLADSGYQHDKALLLLKLAQAIQQQLELQLSSPEPLLLDLEQKNQGLIQSLKQRLVITDEQRLNHCHENSALALINY